MFSVWDVFHFYVLGKRTIEVNSVDGNKSVEGIESQSDGEHIPPLSVKHQDTLRQSNATKPVNKCT